MTELLPERSKMDFSKGYYMFKNKSRIEKKYEFVLKLDYGTYNNNMKQNIILLKSRYENYREIDKYYSELTKQFNRIENDKKRLSGMPVIKNTRIPVSLIIACLKDEMTFQEICDEYRLTQKDIEEAMEYVIEVLDTPYQEGLE
jgi:uncharacterized protein (DUF433 family)